MTTETKALEFEHDGEGQWEAASRTMTDDGSPFMWAIHMTDAGQFFLRLPELDVKHGEFPTFAEAVAEANRLDRESTGQAVVSMVDAISTQQDHGAYSRRSEVGGSSGAAKVKACVIDGPGEYVASVYGKEMVLDVRKITTKDGAVCWVAQIPTGMGMFCRDGTTYCDEMYIIRKAEPEPESKLLEPLGEGLWWLSDSLEAVRFKAHVRRNAVGDRWLVEYRRERGDRSTYDDCLYLDDADNGSLGALQLIRRVKEPKVRPYESYAEQRALYGEVIRKSDGGSVWTVRAIDRHLLQIESAGQVKHVQQYDWRELTRWFTHLDGSPCGVLEGLDPWDTPAN